MHGFFVDRDGLQFTLFKASCHVPCSIMVQVRWGTEAQWKTGRNISSAAWLMLMVGFGAGLDANSAWAVDQYSQLKGPGSQTHFVTHAQTPGCGVTAK